MAADIRGLCVHCKIRHENKSEKVLKCYGTCENFMHYACGSFKPSEIKFLETNTVNVKWCCDSCINKEKDSSVSEIHSKLTYLNNKFDELVTNINRQSVTIENQSKLINNLEETIRNLAGKQTVSTQESARGPATRSKTCVLDVARDTMLYSKAVNNSQNKKPNKTPSFEKTDTTHEEDAKIQKETKTVVDDMTANTTTHAQKIDALKESENGKTNTIKTTTNRKTIRGNRSNTTITAAQNRRWVFISQLLKTTTEDDVKQYLQENKIDIINCNRLEIKSTEIAAFKVAVNEKTYDRMFDAELWPVNTIIRPYKNFHRLAPVKLKT